MRYLPAASAEVVVLHIQHSARHRPFGDIEDPMEVQSLFLRGALPDAYILPAFPITEIPQTAFQPCFETFLRMQFTIVSQRF